MSFNSPSSEVPLTEIPKQGRLAGIDYGTVRIGISTCDPSQQWVTPLATYTRRNDRLDEIYFSQLVEKVQLMGWIIGLPIHCDGKESQKSTEARRFASWLKQLSSLPVELFDERFTTAEARRLLNQTNISPQKKKKRLDGLSAHLILSHYLESRRNSKSHCEAIDD